MPSCHCAPKYPIFFPASSILLSLLCGCPLSYASPVSHSKAWPRGLTWPPSYTMTYSDLPLLLSEPLPGKPMQSYWDLCHFSDVWSQLSSGKNCEPQFSPSVKGGSWARWFLQFSRSVVSDSLRLHGLQHTRLPCPSPTPGACSNSCPSSRWCHPTISSSVVPFSSSVVPFSSWFLSTVIQCVSESLLCICDVGSWGKGSREHLSNDISLFGCLLFWLLTFSLMLTWSLSSELMEEC